MPDTAELRTRESADTAWLFVVSGVGAWTNAEALAGVSDYFGDGRPLYSGLTPPRVQLGIDVLDARHEDFRTTFQIQDQRTGSTGYLASLFRAWHDSEEPLDLTLDASDQATAVAQVLGRHVGTEYIAADGSRAQWPAFPGWTIGDQHLGLDYENAELPAATVSDVPVVFRGRRCALYRVYRDAETYPDDRSQGWRPWTEAVRRWWGTLEDTGTVDGSIWSISARGPDSLLAGTLGSLTQSRQVSVSVAQLELDDDERGVAMRLRSVRSNPPAAPATGSRAHGESVDFSLQLAATYGDAFDLAAAVNTLVQARAADATPADGAFNAIEGQSVRFEADEVGIRIDDDDGLGFSRMAILEIAMHRKVWTWLGWDLTVQDASLNPLDLDETIPGVGDHDKLAQGFPFSALPSEQTETPGPGYVTVFFDTRAGTDDALGWDNQGVEQVFRPRYFGGSAVLPAELGDGVTVSLANADGGVVRHTGQFDRPPSDIGAPAGATLRQGLWLLEGPRVIGSGDDVEETQIVVATWREGNFPGSVGAGVDPEITITRWLDPRRFGIPRDSVPESGFDWQILQNDPDNMVKATPLLRLGYVEHGYSDRVEEVVLRLLHSTGASEGWTGFEGDAAATFDTTPNEPALVGGTFDAEVADLGLAIPQQLIASATQWRAEFAKIADGAFRNLAAAVRPGVQVLDLLEQWLRFYGVVPSLAGGQYGVRTLLERFSPADVEVVLGQSQKAARPGSIARTKQHLRVYQPIDTFELAYQYDPAAEKFRREVKIRANDRGARYRTDGGTIDVSPRGVRNVNGWLARRTEIAAFWERRHFMLRGWPILSRSVGEQVWPGTIVQLTEPRGVSQDGSYQIAAQIGMVVAYREDARRKTAAVDVLVQAGSSEPFSVFAPSALAYGIDNATNEILVADDWADNGADGWSDAAAFVEPAWSAAGGALDVKGLQWDGATLSETWTGTIAGVTTTAGAARLQLTAAPTGTYYRDMPCLVVPREAANQGAAWALQYLAITGDDAGQYGAGVASSRWVD